MNQRIIKPTCSKTAAALMILTFIITSNITQAENTSALPVETAKVTTLDGQIPLWTPATVVSRQAANIAPEISGRLEWLAEVGSTVLAGEPIARINDRAWQLQLRTDEAELKRLKVNEEFLHRQLERFTTLSDSNSMAASELDRLTMELRMLEQERAAREARRDGTLYNIEVTTIAAPFSGLIVERNAELGEFARAGEPVLRIVNTADLEVRARAPVSVARHVLPGQKILLEGGDNRFEATVKTIIPSGDDLSRMVEVRVRIPAGDWVIGEAVRVALPNGTSLQQLAVSRDALVLRNREAYVFKIMENATAKRILVRPGNGAGEAITIEGDLTIGDEVVVRGAETLRDGQSIRILGESTAAHATGQTADNG